MTPSSTADAPLNDADTAQREVDARATRIRVKNRRKVYLDLHPDYFTDDSRELADPLLYDRLVRRFMTAEEREQQGRARGLASVLEANLTRSEAKLEALEHPDPDNPLVYVRESDGSIIGVEQDEEARPENKETAWARWTEFLSQKFIRGEDWEMDYAAIDDSEKYDDHAGREQDQLEAYVRSEDAQFVGEGIPQGQTGVQDF